MQTEKILNRVQRDWKLTITPFKELALEVDMDEEALISSLGDLKKENIIRDISGIFNASGLGYRSALIAFCVPDDGIDSASAIISGHSMVSHNYLRDHAFNIWFTLAGKTDELLENEVKTLALKAKAEDFLIFRSERVAKIGLMLRMGDDDGEELPGQGNIIHNNYRELTIEEKKAVYVLQNDIPLVHRPFAELIERLNIDIDEETVVHTGEELKKENILRRYAAVLKHIKAGYGYNAMTVWKSDDPEIIERIFAPVRNISHLYLRTVYPGKWEHGLFAMIHAKSEDELDSIIKKLENQSGIKDYLVLRSIKEFKKKRIKYFIDGF